MSNIIQTFPKGNGGGHTILDSEGTALAQEKNLKITGLSITDNLADESTDLTPAGLNQDSIDDIAGAGLPETILVGSGFNYSTTEQIVGRWIDGKPLYQKTIFISSINMGSWTRSTIDTTNLLDNEHITVYNMFGGYYADFGGEYQQFHLWGDPGFVKENERYGYSAHYRQAQKQIAIDGTWGNMSYTISNLSFTFQYTKTTD